MNFQPNHHGSFGNTGIRVPPSAFGAAALSNARRIISDQTKREICAEWFRLAVPPVAIVLPPVESDASGLKTIPGTFHRLEIAPDEVVVIGRVRSDRARADYDAARRLLGPNHLPRLVAVDAGDRAPTLATSPADREQCRKKILTAISDLAESKSAGGIAGIGLVARDWRLVREVDRLAPLDWVMLAGCYTILRYTPELVEFMQSLADRNVPILATGILHGGFLTGGTTLDGRTIYAENPADQSLLTWRKSFAALCFGHAVTPIQACTQFAIAGPGVAAVVVNTSRPERIAEHVAAASAEVPSAFWESMQEEGLVAPEHGWLQ